MTSLALRQLLAMFEACQDDAGSCAGSKLTLTQHMQNQNSVMRELIMSPWHDVALSLGEKQQTLLPLDPEALEVWVCTQTHVAQIHFLLVGG